MAQRYENIFQRDMKIYFRENMIELVGQLEGTMESWEKKRNDK
jgi:hypothetical protein